MAYGYQSRRQTKLPGLSIKKPPVKGIEPILKSIGNQPLPISSTHQIAQIRKILKAKCPTFSVTGGSGTVYGWVYIRGSAPHGFTRDEKKALLELGLTTREDADPGNEELINSLDREYWLKKWLGRLTPEEAERHKKEVYERSYD